MGGACERWAGRDCRWEKWMWMSEEEVNLGVDKGGRGGFKFECLGLRLDGLAWERVREVSVGNVDVDN